MIAEATAVLLAQVATPEGFRPKPEQTGVFHATAGGAATWHTFARAILERDPAPAEQRTRVVRALRSSEYPTPAQRPHNSLLDNKRLHTTFGIILPDWTTQLDGAMRDAADWYARGRPL